MTLDVDEGATASRRLHHRCGSSDASEASIKEARVHRCAKARSAALGTDMASTVDECATAGWLHQHRCGSEKFH